MRGLKKFFSRNYSYISRYLTNRKIDIAKKVVIAKIFNGEINFSQHNVV